MADGWIIHGALLLAKEEMLLVEIVELTMLIAEEGVLVLREDGGLDSKLD